MSSLKIKNVHSHQSVKEEEIHFVNESDIYADVDIVDVEEVVEQEPHFLDYDAVPPPEYNESFNFSLPLNSREQKFLKTNEDKAMIIDGEQLKVDKKYERDGEISDFELAASGYTKKEFTQDDNTLHLARLPDSGNRDISNKAPFGKSKHFLDENPIPPDYMIDQELREHRSLDRNFERHNEHRTRTSSIERKCSLEGVTRPSREKFKEPFYTLSRFLDSEGEGNTTCSKFQNHIPKGEAWTVSSNHQLDSSHFASIHPTLSSETDTLGPKVECVYSLLSMLGSNDTLEMSKKFLELSRTPETCAALRRSGCIPLLVQIMNSDGEDCVRKCASMALHNVVHSHTDERAGRREAKVLRLLDQLIEYCNFLKSLLQSGGEAIADDSERHPLAAISSLMKVSFDEEHRHAMCELGALHVIPSLVHLDHAVHGPKPEEQCCNSLRRYALMALTNLTFGDENNKALLCSQKLFMEALVVQLDCAPDDLLQVTASVLRNLSWRADNNMKAVLNEIGTVTALANAAMKNKSENTLKAILSALWNLSAHCGTNKAEFCAVEGALGFLVDMLTYEGPSKTLKIIENAGGILRNVSSHIAVCGHYREILRERNCLGILLQQLKSESLTVVSNSCGTLWNLSARCPKDQKFLWDNGAVPMLRSLIHSKHAMISEGSSSALKNLLNFRPSIQNQTQLDHIARSMGLKKLPTLNARKQKALEQELGSKNHSETCDNLDSGPRLPSDHMNFENQIKIKRICSTVDSDICSAHVVPLQVANLCRSTILPKSDSRDSVFSAKSDSAYENFMRANSDMDGNMHTKTIKYAAEVKKDVYPFNNDVECHTEEKPIDYSVQFNESTTKTSFKDCNGTNINVAHDADSGSGKYASYQETDIDQPTDFSLRYAENQVESDIEAPPPDADVTSGDCRMDTTKENEIQQVNSGNEILLILEDSVKCYQTEDTPYVISNAASVTDLHQNKAYNTGIERNKSNSAVGVQGNNKKYQKVTHPLPTSNLGFGALTPEKPINYCEEGTPGYFSRYESLSSLNESPPQDEKSLVLSTAQEPEEIKCEIDETINSGNEDLSLILSDGGCKDQEQKLVDCSSMNNNINSALETPLMFSRHSSLDSLVEEEVCPCDDKSSVVSDFSRMASGVISPSEIPDSPTQSMPQSPRRSSGLGIHLEPNRSAVDCKQIRLRSVFEDNLNTFQEENTPAQFSSATSLSNLSIIEDDNPSNQSINTKAKLSSKDSTVVKLDNVTLHTNAISEGEEESEVHDDAILLAKCINMGMSRSATSPAKKNLSDSKVLMELPSNLLSTIEIPTHYCTEDTPALLSKVGSHTNLSVISINSNIRCKEENVAHLEAKCQGSEKSFNLNRDSSNFYDGISSNASEAGDNVQSLTVLEQCIQDGMKKSSSVVSGSTSKLNHNDPIEMMRSGGNNIGYLCVSDEVSNFVVEDTPCNFSVISALSNLTVGSSLVGPAVQLEENPKTEATPLAESAGNKRISQNVDNYPEDSLSSLSIDSEDDTNLLSQAIAAGCNRPKSNLGFSSLTISSKRPSLSVSQPISINSALSTSSLTSTAPSKFPYDRQHSKQNNNDSYSSVDSSDSNDNQSKSLFELCILTGMNKGHHSSSGTNNRKEKLIHNNFRNESASTSSTRLKNIRSITDSSQASKHSNKAQSWTQHEQERKDEQILRECINTGISKKIGGNLVPSNEDLSSQSITKVSEQSINCNVPKNAKATSAAALEPYPKKEVITSQSANSTVAPDVGKNTAKVKNTNKYTLDVVADDLKRHQIEIHQKPTPVTITNSRTQEIDQTNMIDIGYKNTNSVKTENGSGIEISEGCPSSALILETSLMIESINKNVPVPVNKHKDPDLMLLSVERLTQEFVSSAELLRTNGSSDSNGQYKLMTINSLPDTASSHSNNTWNEDTCPNDISFPSVSISAPIVGFLNSNEYDGDDNESTDTNHRELNDFAEITPTNEERPEAAMDTIYNDMDFISHQAQQQPYSIETDSDTLVIKNQLDSIEQHYEIGSSGEVAGSGIKFIVGGEVQNASVTRPLHLVNSYMNNSTIIALEARNLAENFLQEYEESNKFTHSINSLDLDNIRPPSGMESLNISGYFDEPSKVNLMLPQSFGMPRSSKSQSPSALTKSPKFPKKSFPAGLVARRALGQIPPALSGSAESVNSSCMLLENIKPPSLMDELLDSMISVASIQSEIADCDSLATTVSVSNYETAAGGIDFDNTITLQSYCDAALPLDKEEDMSINSGTLLESDFEYSSAESTPKKSGDITHGVKRTLTPKQKRKMAKDRFKTYTIVPNIVLDNIQKKGIVDANNPDDENIQIEIEEHAMLHQIDSLSKGRVNLISYKIQNITQAKTLESSIESNLEKPVNINNDSTLNGDEMSCTTANLGFDYELNSVEYDQNSETESCHGEDSKNFELKTDNHKVSNERLKESYPTIRARIAKPGETVALNCNEMSEVEQNIAIRGRKKPAYVSPYKMQIQRSANAKKQKKTIELSPPTVGKIKLNAIVSPKGTSPVKKVNDQSIKNVASIERQGTFIKEEPTTSNVCVPVVDVICKHSGSPNHTSKLPTKKVFSSPKSNIKISNMRNIPTVSTSKMNPIGKATATQRSNSNTSLKVASASARSAALASRISITTPPSRSNSNLTSNTLATIAPKPSHVQSRIASIWKRADDKNKHKSVKTASSVNLKTDVVSIQKNLFKSSSSSINKEKPTVRKSTFDGTLKSEDKTSKTDQLNSRTESKLVPSRLAVNKTSFLRKENTSRK